MSCNRLGQIIAFSHAAITAEGDNRVLMQKVAKELLPRGMIETEKKNIDLVSGKPSLQDLGYLLHARYASHQNALLNKVLVLKPTEVFDVWMKKESDLVQATSESFGEDFVYQQTLQTLNGLSNARSKRVVGQLAALYAIQCITTNLSWYMIEGLIDSEEARCIDKHFSTLCVDLAQEVPSLLNAFEIPEELMNTPIASDWIAFNEVKNEGEIVGNINFA